MTIRQFYIKTPEQINGGKYWKADIIENGKIYTTAITGKVYGEWVADYALLHLTHELRKEKYKGKIEINSDEHLLNYDEQYIKDYILTDIVPLDTVKDNERFYYYQTLAYLTARNNGIIIKVKEEPRKTAKQEEKEQEEWYAQKKAEAKRQKQTDKMFKILNEHLEKQRQNAQK